MIVEIKSSLNVDGYVINGRFYPWNKIDEIKEMIGDNDVTFIKGRNVFRGEPVSDIFFESMKRNLGY